MGDTRKTKGDLSWADMLAESRLPDVKPPPDGWKTVKEVAVEIGRSEAQTQRLLKDATEQGGAERRQFPVWTGVRYYPTFHYRMIEK